jgi:single-strand DNA-binding protein
MSRSLNKTTLIGNVGAKPEVVRSQGGAKIARLSLATTRSWDKDGQRQEKTEWHRLVVFGRLADVVEQYVNKGDRLYVEGRLEHSETGEGDNRKFFTSIVVNEMIMLGGKGEVEQAVRAPARIAEPESDHTFDPEALPF